MTAKEIVLKKEPSAQIKRLFIGGSYNNYQVWLFQNPISHTQCRESWAWAEAARNLTPPVK